jgi:hypothetical protein
MLQANCACIHDLSSHVALPGPVDVDPGCQELAETTVDPDQTALVVLQVQYHCSAVQRSRPDNQVQLFMDQFRVTL